MFVRTVFSKNSKFREKRVNHIMKIGHVLSQIKFYSVWKYKSVNKPN